jgi:hypothetical protein
LDDDAKVWLEKKAEDTGVSQGEIVRHLIEGVRVSDTLTVSDLIHSDTGLNKSDSQNDTDMNKVESLQERVKEHERRLSELETRYNRSRGSEAFETTSETGGGTEGGRADVDGKGEQNLDDARRRVQEQISDGPPRKSYAREAIVEAVVLLVEQGPMATGELKDALWPEYEEHYSTKRTMWNSLDRHLEEIDGVSKPGYGEWDADPDAL